MTISPFPSFHRHCDCDTSCNGYGPCNTCDDECYSFDGYECTICDGECYEYVECTCDFTCYSYIGT